MEMTRIVITAGEHAGVVVALPTAQALRLLAMGRAQLPELLGLGSSTVDAAPAPRQAAQPALPIQHQQAQHAPSFGGQRWCRNYMTRDYSIRSIAPAAWGAN